MRARRLLIVVATVVCAVAGFMGAGSASADDGDVQADRFFLINLATDQCADLSVKPTTGTEVVQEPCTRRPTQVWLAQLLQTEQELFFQIINQSTNLCMDPSKVVGDGIPVVLAPCNAKLRSQHWQFQFGPVAGPVRVVNRALGQCLEVKDGSLAEGAPIQVSTCDDSVQHQEWQKLQVPRPV